MILVERQGQLLEVVLTASTRRRLSGLLHGAEEQAHEDRRDGDDDE
jgi:hypothetical protein